MLKVKELKKQFGNKVVLSNINLNVNEGEVVAIIGPSGSGKSTFLRCLNLLERPDSGVISINNVECDIRHSGRKIERQLRLQTSMVFQHYNLFKNKTALQNITEALIIGKKIPKEEANKIGTDLLEMVGLVDQARQYPITLSGGQQQRVSIARALAVDPKVLLLDEPTSALDPERVNEVLGVIQKLALNKTTMIIVTHEMEFARKIADRVVFMSDGIIVEEGTSHQIFNHPKEELTQRFLRQSLQIVDYVI